MSKTNAARKAHSDLGKEVAKLAKQVVAVIQDPVVQGEVKGIGKEALRGLRTTGGRIAKALRKAKESEATQEIKSQAKRVYGVGKRQGGKTAKRVSADLVTGLHRLGDELKTLSKNLHKKG